ncbi:MAG: hypothetical protein ACT4ON_03980 [Bacteroidota bacterium]
MKKLSKSLLKGLLVIILFTGGSIVLSTSGVKTVNEAQANVSEAEVIEYLEYCGYQVVSAAPKPNTISDWICDTWSDGNHNWTTVYVQGSSIVTHGDVPN